MGGCLQCSFFACTRCLLRFRENGNSFEMKPVPSTQERQEDGARKLAEQRVKKLKERETLAQHFNLAPVLDCGIIRCFPDKSETAHYVKRGDDGKLCPLADPYDYYARSVIHYSMARICSAPNERDEMFQMLNQPLHQQRKIVQMIAGETARRDLIAVLDSEEAAIYSRLRTERQARERVALLLTNAHGQGLLHGMAISLLQEAHEALCIALEGAGDRGANRLAQQQFAFARSHNPRSGWAADVRSREEKAAADPRLWYLMGLILIDRAQLKYQQNDLIGAREDFNGAQLKYRQTLSRLPMSCFGHIVHFNLACLQAYESCAEAARAEAAKGEATKATAVKSSEAASVAALRELKEFRRHCCAMQGLRVGEPALALCELCGVSVEKSLSSFGDRAGYA